MLPPADFLDDGGMNAEPFTLPAPVAPRSAGFVTIVPPLPPALRTPVVEARELTRLWGRGAAAQIGIAGVDLDIGRGELVAIVGPSGSGKSTLGALIAGIDSPTSGSLVVNGTRIDRMRTDQLAAWRGANVGIVFQDFHLLPTLTAQENVELAIELSDRRLGRRSRKRTAREALDRVALGPHARKLPAQMSGGEQQRVGIARALVTRPALVVADEPTGALDQTNGHAVFDLLVELGRAGTTVVFITHDVALAGAADRVVAMIDGRIASVTDRQSMTSAGVVR
jgi:putative ABC transport system ATP-binding protein